MRFNKVVAKFIHKDLIARVDCTAGEMLAPRDQTPPHDIKILFQLFRRTVNNEILMLADHAREREEKEKFLSAPRP